MRDEQRIGETLDGKYTIDRVIGRGGMGAVFAGTQLSLDRPVAIKVLGGEFSSDTVMLSRFQREARAAARIEHANAVAVYDFGSTDDGNASLVMELVDGVSMRDLLKDRKKLGIASAVSLAMQAASALESAHRAGIVHRDVKPENLIVRFDEEGAPSLKVVDFGIAKVLSSSTLTQLTQPFELIGTPKYMAPEQFSGDETDARLDVYSLGVVLYEMLVGRVPFEGNLTEVVGKHVYAEVPPMKNFGADIPEEIEAVVMRALAKSPADRYQSAAEFGRALAAASGLAYGSGSLLRSSGALAAAASMAADSSELTQTGAAIALENDDPDSYRTRVADRREIEVDSDEPTRVRRPAPAPVRPHVPTLFLDRSAASTDDKSTASTGAAVPATATAEPARPVRVKGTAHAKAPRVTSRDLVAAASARRWPIPAAIGLGAILLVGGAIHAGSAAGEPTAEASAPSNDGAIAAQTAAPAAAAATAPAGRTAERASSAGRKAHATRETAAAADDDKGESAAGSDHASDRSSRAASSRRGGPARAANRPAPQRNRVVRALRIDQHLRRIF